MAHTVGTEVYFKGEKFKIIDVYRPLGTYECYTIEDLQGRRKRAFRYELTSVTEIETCMWDGDDDIFRSIDTEQQFVERETPERFASASEERLQYLSLQKNEQSTDKQTKWGVRLFKEWLQATGRCPVFEDLDADALNDTLRKFYAEVRTKSGNPYSKSALIGIRAGLNRYLTSPPFERCINLMGDRCFMTSNNLLLGLIKEQRREGRDTTQHHEPISDGDMKKMYTSRVLSCDNPKSLLRKVWFEILFHLGRRGREGLRNLKPGSFAFRTDDAGVEFVEMAFNESDKNHKGINSREVNKRLRMYATSDENCPVKSLRLYLNKRHPECEAFFQRPLSKVSDNQSIWFFNRPMGLLTLGNLMSDISKDAKLSRRYTNHCIRATTATALADAGVSMIDVMSVTGHRNESSLRSYITKPSVNRRREISGILHSSTTSHQDIVPITGNPMSEKPVSSAPVPLVTSAATDISRQSALISNQSTCLSLPQSYGHFGGFFQNATISNSTVTINLTGPASK